MDGWQKLLVEEEAGLLPLVRIDAEAQSRLADLRRRPRALRWGNVRPCHDDQRLAASGRARGQPRVPPRRSDAPAAGNGAGRRPPASGR